MPISGWNIGTSDNLVVPEDFILVATFTQGTAMLRANGDGILSMLLGNITRRGGIGR